MKNMILKGFVLGSLIFGLAVVGSASPLLDNTPTEGSSKTLSIEGSNYIFWDRSSNLDAWNGSDGYMSTDSSYDGLYIGTLGLLDGQAANMLNDDAIISDILGYFLDKASTFSIANLEKIEGDSGTSGAITIFTVDDGYHGTWLTDGSVSVDFYALKSSTELAMYYLDDSLTTGKWSTQHLLTPNGSNIPDLSHYSASLVDVSPVPEPATMLLFGTGLVGLAGIARRRNKK